MLSVTFRSASRQLGTHAMRALSARYASSLSSLKEHVVIALGGNALLKRGEDLTIANQRKNIQEGMKSLAAVINQHPTTLVHGNGPQVGLLMLEGAAYEKETGLEQISLDVLDAETEGMIGYMLEQELQPYLARGRGLVTVLSQIVVSPNDPSMLNPTKFVGPVLTKEQAAKLTVPIKPDGKYYRRVVPSPLPVQMVEHELQVVRQLTASNCVVICGGGGGIPVMEDPVTGKYIGIEAVIDKDRAATMIGIALQARGLLILTDVPAVATDFGKSDQMYIRSVAAQKLASMHHHFPAGSMGPKVEAAVEFVEKTGGWAAIGSLQDAPKILSGHAGTTILGNAPADFIEYYHTEEQQVA